MIIVIPGLEECIGELKTETGAYYLLHSYADICIFIAAFGEVILSASVESKT